MDALTLLTADHNRVRGLFSQFEKADEADDTTAKASAASKIATELEVHTTIEEELFYPWARGLSAEIAEVVEEGVEEHHEVKILLGEIAGLDVGDHAWQAKMTVVIENVKHHAEEEEQEMFPKIRSHSTGSDRDTVGEELDQRKGQLGAPTLAATIDLTDEALHRLATEQSIPGRSTLSHDELAAAVNPS